MNELGESWGGSLALQENKLIMTDPKTFWLCKNITRKYAIYLELNFFTENDDSLSYGHLKMNCLLSLEM